MKLTKLIVKSLALSILCLSMFIIYDVKATETEASLKAQKEMNMMEFMESFYSNDKKAENLIQSSLKNNEHAKKNHAKNKHHKRKTKTRTTNKLRFKQQEQPDARQIIQEEISRNKNISHNCTEVQSIAGTPQILKVHAEKNDTFANEWAKFGPPEGNITIEGELYISSPIFANRERFPPVTMPDGSTLDILYNNDMFRINGQKCIPSECKLNFWFRLAPNLHLYYAANEKDMNILGVLSIQNVIAVENIKMQPDTTECGPAYCFDLKDNTNSNWKLCAYSLKNARRWVCSIKKELGQTDDLCNLGGEKTIIKTKVVKEPVIIIPLPSRHCNDGWNYQQNGADWECTCKEGREQSPIDLPAISEAIDSPVKPVFGYTEVEARSQVETIDRIMMVDNPIKMQLFKGALRLFHHNFGKVTTLDGAIYNAEEIVFHTPSEHTINGNQYDMEVQIIHYGVTKGDISKQLVLSFLIEKKAGVYNQFFDDLDIFNLPDHTSKEREISNNIYIPKIFFRSDNAEMASMKPFSFYTYQGSLTFPPCSERTIHYVNSTPIQLSSTTIELFKEAIRVPDMVDPKGNVIVSDWVPVSNRNVQERNGRPVFHYDHLKYCGPEPAPRAPVPQGHYEKVEQKQTNFFYVNGEKPSGLPGAFVVSEKEAKGVDKDAA